MRHYYDEYENDCEGPTCQLVKGIVVDFIFYGIVVAVILKLLRADKLAGFTFNAAFYVPILLGMIFLPIGLIYSFFHYFNLFSEHRWLISILIIVVLAAIIYINYYRSNRTSYSIAWWDLKGWYQDYRSDRFWSSEQVEHRNRSNEQHLDQLDAAIHKEIEQRVSYQLLAIGFAIFVYFWFQDYKVFRPIYYFLDYGSPLIKYPLLFCTLVLVIYGYTKYYNIFAKKRFSQIIAVATILEKEGKFIYFKDKNPHGFTIQTKTPRTLTEPTKYYYFDLFDDAEEEVFAYWINPRLDYKHYVEVMKKIKLIGFEKFLDLVNSRQHLRNDRATMARR